MTDDLAVGGPEPAVPAGQTLEGLLRILDLERIEDDIFRGRSPHGGPQRVFGGQVAGQALVAAGRTVPADRHVHSLHAYFIRPGDPSVPIVYEVDRVRDGRSFTTRRVVAVQHGKAIFTLSASFHKEEPGLEHQVPMPDVPAPEDLPTTRERLFAAFGKVPRFASWHPIEMRPAGPLSFEVERDPGLSTTRNLVWLRVDGELPDDPLLHVCLMTYASDMTLLDTVLLRHGRSFAGISMASLDHAMWFHRSFRADEWLLYAQETPSATGARGLARGLFFTRGGTLVCSVVQEGLIRVLDRGDSASS
ncbi:acyl-CoA thioesterase II [Nocardiopsis mangrovi]|uniref:Acyl-CoA thioesterase II n=1 Tax=Nocardiopsis mangrovi TaxID=1179818 RepID=A0ABV9DPR6_9ACTN